MPFAQGDVVVLPFPYSDRLAEKRRPAVVISKPALERTHGLIWVAMVTSDRGANKANDVPVSDLKRAGLPAPSLVRAVKIATIEPGRVVRRAGAISRADLASVVATINQFS
jgi:mRNA interferase MazF